ncbi:hypothetical protein V2J09_014140 [Rumex salicifolius]
MACAYYSMFSILLHFTLLPFLCTIAQQKSPIKVGSTLSTDNSTWLSPSGEFALGFRQLNDATFLLSVWYTIIPETLVWYADQDGILAPKGSVLKCAADQGGLVINDPQGRNLYNNSNTEAGTVSYCFLNDTGNLLTKGAQGNTIWQSFDYPTDTLLPSQNIRNSASGGPFVYSRHSKSSFTRGKFQLRLLRDGDLVLNTRSLVTNYAYDGAYYISGTNDPNNATNSGHMYILKRNGDQLDLLQGATFPSPTSDFYFRATLNSDGVLVWYYHKKDGSSTWTALKSVPDDICLSKTGTMDGGVCGFNSICKLNQAGDYPAPTCECPPMYSLLDPNDSFGSCRPDFRLPTNNEKVGNYRLEMLPSTDWPNRDYDQLSPFTEDECKTSCLNDYLCVAVILDYQTCWKKGLPLINGRVDDSRTAFVKVSDVNDNGTRQRKGMSPLISTLMGTSMFVNLLLLGTFFGIWFFCHRENKARHTVNKAVDTWDNISCFTYKDLEEATKGFKEEIGRGACAIVYKGGIQGCQTLVAIKKIDCALFREADKEFKTEVSIIGKTHHKNLVRLIGVCHEDEHRMLVYEFMRNGSLADFLFGETSPNWLVRVQISLGVAKGLLYLHEECDNQIIHCDIKPQNILLDDNFEAKISDFGLSKLLMLNQYQTHTGIRGTKGYVAPEWFRNKPVTAKVDVYSFGVVLLELISCRRCINFEPTGDEIFILIDWAYDCYQFGDLSSLVDNDMEALADKIRLERFIMVALWCIQEDPNLRPTMKQVNSMLEGVVQVCAPPELKQDSFSVSIN